MSVTSFAIITATKWEFIELGEKIILYSLQARNLVNSSIYSSIEYVFWYFTYFQTNILLYF